MTNRIQYRYGATGLPSGGKKIKKKKILFTFPGKAKLKLEYVYC